MGFREEIYTESSEIFQSSTPGNKNEALDNMLFWWDSVTRFFSSVFFANLAHRALIDILKISYMALIWHRKFDYFSSLLDWHRGVKNLASDNQLLKLDF